MKTFHFIVLMLPALYGFCQENEKGVNSVDVLQRPLGKVYALIVGVSDYQSELINDLHYASADARALADYLRIAPINLGMLIDLYDKQATRSAIYQKGLRTINDMVFDRTIKPGDLILVYFSGHGGAFTKNDSYFFPHDAAHTTDAGSSFSIRDIKSFVEQWANPEKKLTVLFIFDACRSSTLAKGQSEMDLGQVSKFLEEDNGEILMAASQGGEPAREIGELKHGVFSYFLLEGLYGKADINQDGYVSTSEIQNYVSSNVYNKTATAQAPLIKYPAGYQRTNLFPVKQEILALADQKLVLDLSNAQVVEMNKKGGNESAKAQKLSELVGKFNTRLAGGTLVRPATDCAWHYYQEMTKIVPDSTLRDFRTDLNIALYDAALKVIKHDLNGERNYIMRLRPGDDGKKDYNLNYYADARQSMRLYLDLNNGEVEKIAQAMHDYLAGRDLTIRFNETYEDVGGKTSYDKELIKSAVNTLQNACKKFPDQAFLWQGLAMALLADPATTYDKAITAATKAKNLAPQWSYPLVTLGQCASGQNDLTGAKSYFQKAIELNPHDVSALLILGDNQTDPTLAMEYFRKAYTIDSLSLFNIYALGYGHYRLNNKKEALRQFERVYAQNPNFRIVALLIGVCYYELERYQDAINSYELYLKANPDDSQTLYNLGLALSEIGQNVEAIKQYQRAIKLDSSRADYYNNLAITLSDIGQYEEAIKQYQHAIKLDSSNALFYHNLANTLSNIGQEEKAINHYRNAIRLDSSIALFYHNLARTLSNIGQEEKAINHYRHAIRLDSSNADFYNSLASTLSDVGQNEEAIKQYQHAIKLDSSNVAYYYNLAITLSDIGQNEEAIKQYQHAIRLDSSEADFYNNLAGVLFRVGKKNEAIRQYQHAIKLDSSDASHYINLARTLYYIGQNEEAIKQYQNSLRVDSSNVKTKYWLGKLLMEIGKQDEAKKYLTSVLLMQGTDSTIVAFSHLRLGHTSDAESLMTKIVRQAPNMINHYDLACMLSFLNKKPEAILALSKSFELGLTDWNEIDRNHDLDNIRSMAEFRVLQLKYRILSKSMAEFRDLQLKYRKSH